MRRHISFRGPSTRKIWVCHQSKTLAGQWQRRRRQFEEFWRQITPWDWSSSPNPRISHFRERHEIETYPSKLKKELWIKSQPEYRDLAWAGALPGRDHVKACSFQPSDYSAADLYTAAANIRTRSGEPSKELTKDQQHICAEAATPYHECQQSPTSSGHTLL